MSKDALAAFNKLKAEIYSYPELANNPAVTKSVDDMGKVLADDKSKVYFDALDDIFEAIGDALPKFTSSGSNSADVASGIIGVTAAVLKMTGIVTGAKIVTEPLAYVIKMVGSIVGVFGTTGSTSYFKQLEQILKDALDDQNIKYVNHELDKALNKLRDRHNLIASILSKTYTDPAALLTIYPQISVSYVQEAASDEISASYTSIANYTGKDSKKNWNSIADTYYHISELVAFKILLALEGVAYFQLAELGIPVAGAPAPAYIRTIEMIDQLNIFMTQYAGQSKPYIEKPGIVTAAITHCLYRFPEKQFKFMVLLNHCLNLGNEKQGLPTEQFWPTGTKQYKFACKQNQKHDNKDVSLTDNADKCIRLTTLYAHRDKNKNDQRIFTIPGDTQTEYNNILWNIPIGVLSFKRNKDIKDQAQTHFVLQPVTDGQYDYPPYKWVLQSMNTHKEYNYQYTILEAQFLNTAKDLYIFRVYPTADELSNKGKLFPNDWKNKTPGDHDYIMIGSRASSNKYLEYVWCDHDGESFEKQDYYDIVYNKSHYGNPEHCLWYLLSEDEG